VVAKVAHRGSDGHRLARIDILRRHADLGRKEFQSGRRRYRIAPVGEAIPGEDKGRVRAGIVHGPQAGTGGHVGLVIQHQVPVLGPISDPPRGKLSSSLLLIDKSRDIGFIGGCLLFGINIFRVIGHLGM